MNAFYRFGALVALVVVMLIVGCFSASSGKSVDSDIAGGDASSDASNGEDDVPRHYVIEVPGTPCDGRTSPESFTVWVRYHTVTGIGVWYNPGFPEEKVALFNGGLVEEADAVEIVSGGCGYILAVANQGEIPSDVCLETDNLEVEMDQFISIELIERQVDGFCFDLEPGEQDTWHIGWYPQLE